MTKVDKPRIHAELREILLCEADHLTITASQGIAESFIGFPLGDASRFADADRSQIDLSRFAATELLETCFDYAFTPSILTGHDDSLVQDLQVFINGLPQSNAEGFVYDFMTDKGVCRTVAAAALARFHLDNGFDLSAREVALLANMTDGAIRNALADKGDNSLRAMPGTKNPIMIEHAEALRWLQGRRGFVPTPARLGDDRFLADAIRSTRSAKDLGTLIQRMAWAKFRSPADASKALGWTAEQFQAWIDGKQAFDETDTVSLAEAFGIDVPLFVGKTLEITLRRDRIASAEKEGR